MRYLLVLVVLFALIAMAVPLMAPAAPRLEPKPYFESANAEAYCVLIGPMNVGNTEMTVTYSVRGKKGSTYTVELYVEANSTGEKAEWLRQATVVLKGRLADEEGTATGEFKVRYRFPDEPESPTAPHLPYARSGSDWTTLLILKDGKHIVASSGPAHAPFVSKRLHVDE